jgi:hypothetical protein
MGVSQQDAAAPGCINFPRAGANRHKFNPKADSAALCNADYQCFCLGDCAPIAAHPNPNSVSTEPGTSGTGGNGASAGNAQGATEPSSPPLDRASSSMLGGPVVAGLAAAAVAAAAW